MYSNLSYISADTCFMLFYSFHSYDKHADLVRISCLGLYRCQKSSEKCIDFEMNIDSKQSKNICKKTCIWFQVFVVYINHMRLDLWSTGYNQKDGKEWIQSTTLTQRETTACLPEEAKPMKAKRSTVLAMNFSCLSGILWSSQTNDLLQTGCA